MMSLKPVWRVRLFAVVGGLLAIVFGVQLAYGNYFWPSVGIGLLAALVVRRIQPRPLPVLLLGGAIIGYIIGNRGFAQLSLSASLPVLPAEFVLAIAGSIIALQCALQRELPIRRNWLDVLLLLWIVIGTVRVWFDVRTQGVIALRDYAMVYYAVFFFLAQYIARDPDDARFISRCVRFACGTLVVIHPLFTLWPDFFLSQLTIREIPIIFFKDDLAGNFMAMGSVLFFLHFERTGRKRWILLSLALAGWMLTTNSRSSMVGLAVAAGWLAMRGRWRFGGVLLGSGSLAVLTMIAVAEFGHRSWRDTFLHRVYERVASITDPMGQRAYQTEDAFKGDNNVFRIVWWKASITETTLTSPWVGLGFGHDLAGRFVREYFPEGTSEFTARSPHNILITVFARMGIVGLAIFAAVLAVVAGRTWRALRDPVTALDTGAHWCAAWVILVCACFGVVLEGPMGAVVFWSLLGLAAAGQPGANDALPPATAPLLRTDAATDQVTLAS